MPKGVRIDRAAMREKIEILFMAATNAREPSGAISWCAEECGVGAPNISRWLFEGDSGTLPSRQSLRQLEQLEELVEHRVGTAKITAARIRRRRMLRRM